METKDKDQVVFYYDRNRRLEKASPNARYIIEYAGTGKRGVLRSMVTNRSLVFMLAAVALAMAALFGGTYLHNSRASGTIGGARLSVKAVWFDGYAYVTVKRGAARTESAMEALSIRAEHESGVAEGMLQAMDTEYRFRLPSPEKGGIVSVVVSISGEDGDAVESLAMVATVE